MSPAMKMMLPALVLLLGAGLLTSATGGQAASDPGDEAPSEAARRPISYFNASCANCHGDYGSFWGKGFAADLSDEALHEMVEEMAEGPAQAPLDEAALDVQTAYHRSLVDGKPFLVAWREGDVWKGEVTPKAKIAGGESEATVVGHNWTLSGDVRELRVSLGDATTTLSLDEKQQAHGVWYSHRKEATTQPITRPATTQDAQE